MSSCVQSCDECASWKWMRDLQPIKKKKKPSVVSLGRCQFLELAKTPKDNLKQLQ